MAEEIIFIAPSNGYGGAEMFFTELYEDLNLDTIKFVKLDCRFSSLLTSLKTLWTFRRLPILYNHSVLGICIWPIIILKLFNTKVYLLPHVVASSALTKPKLWALRFFLQWLVLKLADKIIAISQGNFEEIQRRLPNNKTYIIRNYVSFKSKNNHKHDKLDYKSVAIIGRVQEKHKMQIALIKNLAGFLVKNEFRVHIFGDGPDIDELKRHAAQAAGLKIKFHSWRDKSEIYEHNFGIVISNSRWEGLPLSLIEAISHHRIVIARDVPGNIELTQKNYRFSSYDQLSSILRNLNPEMYFKDNQFFFDDLVQSLDKSDALSKYRSLLFDD